MRAPDRQQFLLQDMGSLHQLGRLSSACGRAAWPPEASAAPVLPCYNPPSFCACRAYLHVDLLLPGLHQLAASPLQAQAPDVFVCHPCMWGRHPLHLHGFNFC